MTFEPWPQIQSSRGLLGCPIFPIRRPGSVSKLKPEGLEADTMRPGRIVNIFFVFICFWQCLLWTEEVPGIQPATSCFSSIGQWSRGFPPNWHLIPSIVHYRMWALVKSSVLLKGNHLGHGDLLPVSRNDSWRCENWCYAGMLTIQNVQIFNTH
jgi:hypothetical protein